VHPGEVLSEELEELRVSPTELVRRIAAPTNRIGHIVWTNPQNQFDLAIAQAKAGKAIAALPTSLANQSILTALIR